jgi:hypothetical protein
MTIKTVQFVACDCCGQAARVEETEIEARSRARREGFSRMPIAEAGGVPVMVDMCSRCLPPDHDRSHCLVRTQSLVF